jgi:hypothetical protein
MKFPHRPVLLALMLIAPAGGAMAAEQAAGSPSEPLAPEHRVHAVIAEALAQRFAPADRWEIFVTATPEQRAAGYLPKLEARATNLRLPAGEVIATVAITIEQVRLLLGEGKLDSTGHTVIEARMRDTDMARFLREKGGKKLRNVKIRCHNDRVTAHASVRAGFMSLPVRRRSHPRIQDDAVYAHTYRLEVSGFNLSQRTLRKIDDKINPVIDFKQFRIPIEIEAIEIAEGELVMRLSADLDAAKDVEAVDELEKKKDRRK